MPGQAQLAFDAAGGFDRSNRVDPYSNLVVTVTARCALQPIENASTSGTAPTTAGEVVVDRGDERIDTRSLSGRARRGSSSRG